jgi:hypothetical protein
VLGPDAALVLSRPAVASEAIGADANGNGVLDENEFDT